MTVHSPSSSPAELDVYVDIDGEAVNAARASFTARNARLTTTFTYVRNYLASPQAYAIDPTMPLDAATHTADGLPSALADTAPDSWGRNLISRRVRAESAARGQPMPIVSEVDYLLGVSDLTRQGALRFRAPGERSFLAPDAAVPRLVDLADLLEASETAVTKDDDDPRAQQAVQALLAAGTGTLGGARPKASIRDGDTLYIAKFPSPGQDQWDVPAWEKTALDLAEHVGLPVPERRLVRIAGRSVLLLERFDRADAAATGHTRRVGYVSASTLIGGSRTAERDYLDLQAAIEDHSGDANADLLDLYQRMVFSVAVHNTDDHMRNLAFLRAPEGWRLSPVYDVNPDPELGRPRATAIMGEAMRGREYEALISAAPYFGISGTGAADVIGEIIQATADWRDTADRNGIPEEQMRRFEPAFDGLR